MLASAACLSHNGGAASLAILAPVGEIDPLGTRRDGLDVFLDQKVEEADAIETRSDTLDHLPATEGPQALRAAPTRDATSFRSTKILRPPCKRTMKTTSRPPTLTRSKSPNAETPPDERPGV